MYDVALVVRFIRWILQLYMQCTRTVFATKLLIMIMTRSKVKLRGDEWTVAQWPRIAGEFNKNSSAAEERRRRRGWEEVF